MPAILCGGIGSAEVPKAVSKFGAETAMGGIRRLPGIAGMIGLAAASISPIGGGLAPETAGKTHTPPPAQFDFRAAAA